MTTLVQDAEDRTALVRAAAMGGVVGPVLFSATVAVGAAVTDGYSHVGQKISELGVPGTVTAQLQSANFLVLGVSVLGLAWALARTLGPPRLGPVLVGAFGALAGVLHSVVPCDPGCAGTTPVGLVHNATGLVGFVAAIVGMVVLARRWRGDTEWGDHVRPTMLAAGVAGAALVAFVVTQATGDPAAVGGLVQRVFAGALLLWFVRTGWLLARLVGPRPGGRTVRR